MLEISSDMGEVRVNRNLILVGLTMVCWGHVDIAGSPATQRMPFSAADSVRSLGGGVSAIAANISGVLDYTFNPNPQRISPKRYNWRVQLNRADSIGTFEIIQVTTWAQQTQTQILIPADMVIRDGAGQIHFDLHIGDKEPTLNANGTGNIGHSIIFSGRGTGTGAANAVVLPGAEITGVVVAGRGMVLSNGQLSLIEYTGIGSDGAPYESQVILRRR